MANEQLIKETSPLHTREGLHGVGLKHPENLNGMNDRIRRLRQQNFDTPTTLSIERALIETEFYKQNYGTIFLAVTYELVDYDSVAVKVHTAYELFRVLIYC